MHVDLSYVFRSGGRSEGPNSPSSSLASSSVHCNAARNTAMMLDSTAISYGAAKRLQLSYSAYKEG
jgi:hypothetical protein